MADKSDKRSDKPTPRPEITTPAVYTPSIRVEFEPDDAGETQQLIK